MKVAFSGDRHYRPEYFGLVYCELQKLDPLQDEIVVGDCKTGVDHIVWLLAVHVFGWNCDNLHVKHAEWERFGRGAGPIRNKEIIRERPDYLVGIHSNIAASKGTKDCLKQAQEAGIEVRPRPL